MGYDRPFRAAVFLLVLAGAVTLTLAEINLQGGSPVYLAISIVAIAAAWLLVESSRRSGLPRWTATLLYVVALAYAFLDATAISGDALLALAHLLLLFQLIKLFQDKRDRDWMQLVVLSLMHVGAAAAMTIEVTFAVGLGCYVVVAALAMLLFTLRSATRDVSEDEGSLAQGGGIGRLRLATITFSMMAFMLVSSAMLFFVFPRAGQEFIQGSLLNRGGLIGFSDSTKLGSINDLSQNNAPAMTVKVEGGMIPSDTLRMRGTVYDSYENGEWVNTFTKKYWANQLPQVPQVRPNASASDFDYFIDLQAQPLLEGSDGRVNGRQVVSDLRMDVTLEPLGGRWIFSQATSVEILDEHRLFTKLKLREQKSTGELSLNEKPRGKLRYSLRCHLGPSNLDAYEISTQAPAELRFRSRYLQLPEAMVESNRVRELAVSLTVDAENDIERAQMLEHHLRTGFAYSTSNLAVESGVEPVENFLFNRNSGHCEYFASALVLLLRSLEIPARRVDGFVGGEYNEFAEIYTIRQSDAHAWVEAHIDGLSQLNLSTRGGAQSTGWITLDPSPRAMSERQSTGFAAMLRKLAEFLKVAWDSHVMGFEDRHQKTAIKSVRKGADQTVSTMRQLMKRLRGSPEEPGLFVPLVVMVCLSGSLILFWRSISLARSPQAAAARMREARIMFYRRMVMALERQGLVRTPSETPRELAHRLQQDRGAEFGVIAEITEHYNRVKYGEAELSADELAEVEEMLETLDRLLV